MTTSIIEKKDFLYLEGESVWSFAPPESDYEIIIAGDEHEPDPDHLKCAQRVVAELEILLESATGLLEEFIDYKKLESEGDWQIESLEFGRGIIGVTTPGSFEMLLTIEPDTYGLWSVGFRLSPQADDFFPHQFSRRQD